MVVTGKKCTTERHVSTTRFWEVERIRPYPEGPVVSPLTQNMPGIEAGYEDGVECDLSHSDRDLSSEREERFVDVRALAQLFPVVARPRRAL